MESGSICPLSLADLTELGALEAIHDVAGVRTSFLFKAERYAVVWMDGAWSVHRL